MTGREYIENHKARTAALEKRKMSLRKKAHELSTLCDVPVGVIMYPDASNSTPFTNPENYSKVRSLVDRYLSIPRDEKSSKRRLDLEGVEQLQAKRRRVGDSADFQNNASTSGFNPSLIPNLDGFNRDQLYSLGSVLDRKLQFVQNRIAGFDQGLGFMDSQHLGSLPDNGTAFSEFDHVSGFQFCTSDQDVGLMGDNATFFGAQFYSFGQDMGSSDAAVPDYA